jgi:uncharacterized membrane protein YqjE
MTIETASGSGLSGSLRRLGATLLALGCARAELIAIELEEAKARAGQQLALGFIAALFFALGLLLAALLVIVAFWDTYRLPAAAGVTLLYLGIGGGALLRLQKLNRDSPPPFSVTRSEFARDLTLLRTRDV